MSVAFHSEHIEMEETGEEIYDDIDEPAFHSEHIEMEETGEEIYDDIDEPPPQDQEDVVYENPQVEPPPQDQEDVIYENSQVNPPPQQQQPHQMLPSGEISSYNHPCLALNGTLRHPP